MSDLPEKKAGCGPVLLVNTFEPVVPLYRGLAAVCGKSVSALVSQGDYHTDRDSLDEHMTVHRAWVPRALRNNRRWCGLFYWVLAPWFLFCRRNTNFIFLSQPPLFFMLAPLLAKTKKNNGYLLHVMDLYPHLLFTEGIIRRNGMVGGWLNAMARSAFLHARHVVVIGRCMKERLVGMGLDAGRITIIPNWAHEDCANPGDAHEFRRTHGLEGKFVVMYAGNMGKFHEFATILEVAKKNAGRAELVFVFVGSGVRRRELEAVVERGESNILLLPHQDGSRLGALLRSADIHFVSLRPGIEGLIVPSKFYGILAAGRPVIYEGSGNGEAARVIEENRCGVVITPGDIEGLEKAILDRMNNPMAITQECDRAASVYAEQYGPDKSCRDYFRLIEDCFHAPKNQD